MYNTDIKTIERIKLGYVERQPTKLDELKALHKKAERPAKTFAYTFGSVSALVLGTGMCLAMKIILKGLSFAMPLGIAIGAVGILGVSLNYFIYNKMLAKRKKKYAKEVLALSDELLNQ